MLNLKEETAWNCSGQWWILPWSIWNQVLSIWKSFSLGALRYSFTALLRVCWTLEAMLWFFLTPRKSGLKVSWGSKRGLRVTCFPVFLSMKIIFFISFGIKTISPPFWKNHDDLKYYPCNNPVQQRTSDYPYPWNLPASSFSSSPQMNVPKWCGTHQPSPSTARQWRLNKKVEPT